MELRQFWTIIRRWWWLVILPPLVAGAYSAAVYRPPVQLYSTGLRFTAGQPADGEAFAAGYDSNYYRWLTSEYIVGALKDWVRTGSFAQAVSAELTTRGLTIPAAAIQGAIASDNARSVLLVNLTWNDPEQLTALAEAVTKVLQEQNATVFPQLRNRPAEVVQLDSPGIAPVPPSLRARLDVPLKIGLALAAGLGLALLVNYLDPALHDKRAVEEMGIKVVAEIPGRRKPRPTANV